MKNEALQSIIESWFESEKPVFPEDSSEFLTLRVQPEDLHFLMQSLKTNSETSFDYLFCLTGVDLGKELEVVYHLESTVHRHIIVVKVQTLNRENPVLDSVQDLWSTANFHEREVFDFFGITFRNHPNLKRLFLTEEWVGFPLRKDYVDEKNMVVK